MGTRRVCGGLTASGETGGEMVVVRGKGDEVVGVSSEAIFFLDPTPKVGMLGLRNFVDGEVRYVIAAV